MKLHNLVTVAIFHCNCNSLFFDIATQLVDCDDSSQYFKAAITVFLCTYA